MKIKWFKLRTAFIIFGSVMGLALFLAFMNPGVPSTFVQSREDMGIMEKTLISLRDVLSSLPQLFTNSGQFDDKTAQVLPLANLPQELTMVTPNGGEEIARGQTYTVRWTTQGSIPRVDLYFAKPAAFKACADGGKCPVENNQRYYVAHNIRNTGSYTWRVPAVVGDGQLFGGAPLNGEYLMRVVIPETFRVADESDAAFSLIGGADGGGSEGMSSYLRILSPNGGEIFMASSTQTVTWTVDPSVKSVVLYYYRPADVKPCKNPSGTCIVDIKDRYDIGNELPNTGSAEFTIPEEVESGDYKIHIHRAGSFRIFDESDTTFKIQWDGSDHEGDPSMDPILGQFTCNDVRNGQANDVSPRTRQHTTQIQRRQMVELRLFDCVWRAWRYAQQMYNETTDPALKTLIKTFLDSARLWQTKAMFRTERDALRALDHPGKSATWPITRESYVWIYPPNAFADIRKALALRPDWVAAHADDSMFHLIGMKLVGGKVIESIDKAISLNVKDAQTRNKTVGLFTGGMVFKPHVEDHLRMLDDMQALHSKWAAAAMQKANPAILQDIVLEHHKTHMALEAMARDANEQSLLTIPEHGNHTICWDRPDEITFKLIAQTEKFHNQWIEAVKRLQIGGLNGAWAAGINHARAHIMLANCGVGLPKFGSKEPNAVKDLTPAPQVGDLNP